MKNFANSLNSKNKFLILGCGFSGSFFAKTIRQLGFTALTSSRSEKKDPNSILFNSESGMVPNKKFLILGCGFSGSFFAKTIRKLGCTVLTSSRSASKDPNSFIFNSENSVVPDAKIFDGVTHILSCIPPDKNGNDPVLGSLKNKLKSLPLEWVGYLSLIHI